MRKTDDTICSTCSSGVLYMFTIDFDPVPIRPQLVTTMVSMARFVEFSLKNHQSLGSCISTSWPNIKIKRKYAGVFMR
jgi:hypothetical protein